jgi:hypothetical protein
VTSPPNSLIREGRGAHGRVSHCEFPVVSPPWPILALSWEPSRRLSRHTALHQASHRLQPMSLWVTLRRVTSDPSYQLMGTRQAVWQAAEPPTASGRGAVTKPCGTQEHQLSGCSINACYAPLPTRRKRRKLHVRIWHAECPMRHFLAAATNFSGATRVVHVTSTKLTKRNDCRLSVSSHGKWEQI